MPRKIPHSGGFPLFLPEVSGKAHYGIWPNAAAVCSLSQVLETGQIPSRYFLSAKACAGIIRRAEKRNKVLPPRLMLALAEAARRHSTPAAD